MTYRHITNAPVEIVALLVSEGDGLTRSTGAEDEIKIEYKGPDDLLFRRYDGKVTEIKTAAGEPSGFYTFWLPAQTRPGPLIITAVAAGSLEWRDIHQIEELELDDEARAPADHIVEMEMGPGAEDTTKRVTVTILHPTT